MKRIAIVVLAGAVLAGCGNSPAPYAHKAGMYNEMGSESTFYYPVRQTVVIRDDGISPAHVTVPVDTTIQWVNEGTRKHSVTWTGGRVTHFESGALKPGQSFEIRMAGDGPVTYSSGAYKGGIGVGLSASPKAVGGGHNGS